MDESVKVSGGILITRSQSGTAKCLKVMVLAKPDGDSKEIWVKKRPSKIPVLVKKGKSIYKIPRLVRKWTNKSKIPVLIRNCKRKISRSVHSLNILFHKDKDQLPESGDFETKSKPQFKSKIPRFKTLQEIQSRTSKKSESGQDFQTNTSLSKMKNITRNSCSVINPLPVPSTDKNLLISFTSQPCFRQIIAVSNEEKKPRYGDLRNPFLRETSTISSSLQNFQRQVEHVSYRDYSNPFLQENHSVIASTSSRNLQNGVHQKRSCHTSNLSFKIEEENVTCSSESLKKQSSPSRLKLVASEDLVKPYFKPFTSTSYNLNSRFSDNTQLQGPQCLESFTLDTETIVMYHFEDHSEMPKEEKVTPFFPGGEEDDEEEEKEEFIPDIESKESSTETVFYKRRYIDSGLRRLKESESKLILDMYSYRIKRPKNEKPKENEVEPLLKEIPSGFFRKKEEKKTPEKKKKDLRVVIKEPSKRSLSSESSSSESNLEEDPLEKLKELEDTKFIIEVDKDDLEPKTAEKACSTEDLKKIEKIGDGGVGEIVKDTSEDKKIPPSPTYPGKKDAATEITDLPKKIEPKKDKFVEKPEQNGMKTVVKVRDASTETELKYKARPKLEDDKSKISQLKKDKSEEKPGKSELRTIIKVQDASTETDLKYKPLRKPEEGILRSISTETDVKRQDLPEEIGDKAKIVQNEISTQTDKEYLKKIEEQDEQKLKKKTPSSVEIEKEKEKIDVKPLPPKKDIKPEQPEKDKQAIKPRPSFKGSNIPRRKSSVARPVKDVIKEIPTGAADPGKKSISSILKSTKGDGQDKKSSRSLKSKQDSDKTATKIKSGIKSEESKKKFLKKSESLKVIKDVEEPEKDSDSVFLKEFSKTEISSSKDKDLEGKNLEKVGEASPLKRTSSTFDIIGKLKGEDDFCVHSKEAAESSFSHEDSISVFVRSEELEDTRKEAESKEDDFCIHIKETTQSSFSHEDSISVLIRSEELGDTKKEAESKQDDFCFHTKEISQSSFSNEDSLSVLMRLEEPKKTKEDADLEKDDFCLHTKDTTEYSLSPEDSRASLVAKPEELDTEETEALKTDDFCVHTKDNTEYSLSPDDSKVSLAVPLDSTDTRDNIGYILPPTEDSNVSLVVTIDSTETKDNTGYIQPPEDSKVPFAIPMDSTKEPLAKPPDSNVKEVSNLNYSDVGELKIIIKTCTCDGQEAVQKIVLKSQESEEILKQPTILKEETVDITEIIETEEILDYTVSMKETVRSSDKLVENSSKEGTREKTNKDVTTSTSFEEETEDFNKDKCNKSVETSLISTVSKEGTGDFGTEGTLKNVTTSTSFEEETEDSNRDVSDKSVEAISVASTASKEETRDVTTSTSFKEETEDSNRGVSDKSVEAISAVSTASKEEETRDVTTSTSFKEETEDSSRGISDKSVEAVSVISTVSKEETSDFNTKKTLKDATTLTSSKEKTEDSNKDKRDKLVEGVEDLKASPTVPDSTDTKDNTKYNLPPQTSKVSFAKPPDSSVKEVSELDYSDVEELKIIIKTCSCDGQEGVRKIVLKSEESEEILKEPTSSDRLVEKSAASTVSKEETRDFSEKTLKDATTSISSKEETVDSNEDKNGKTVEESVTSTVSKKESSGFSTERILRDATTSTSSKEEAIDSHKEESKELLQEAQITTSKETVDFSEDKGKEMLKEAATSTTFKEHTMDSTEDKSEELLQEAAKDEVSSDKDKNEELLPESIISKEESVENDKEDQNLQIIDSLVEAKKRLRKQPSLVTEEVEVEIKESKLQVEEAINKELPSESETVKEMSESLNQSEGAELSKESDKTNKEDDLNELFFSKSGEEEAKESKINVKTGEFNVEATPRGRSVTESSSKLSSGISMDFASTRSLLLPSNKERRRLSRQFKQGSEDTVFERSSKSSGHRTLTDDSSNFSTGFFARNKKDKS